MGGGGEGILCSHATSFSVSPLFLITGLYHAVSVWK